MALILEGKSVAAARKEHIRQMIGNLGSNCVPCLAIVLVGDDPASRVYAGRLVKLGDSLGIKVLLRQLPQDTEEAEVLKLIDVLNGDPSIHGILPMLPLPKHISPDRVAERLLPQKDSDSLHPLNAGLVATGKSRWAPCTPRAVMAILEFYKIPLKGRHAVIVGRSNVVGKPLAQLFLAADATVTVCHSRTANLAAIVRQADIVVAAVGRPRLIGAGMVAPESVVVDVGINEVDGALVGDVDYAMVSPLVAAITPVPGGVGTVSTIMVMEAVLRGFAQQADRA